MGRRVIKATRFATFLGRYSRVEYDSEELRFLSRDEVILTLPWKSVVKFPSVYKGLFSATLSFPLGKKVAKARFLNKADLKSNYPKIVELIAQHLDTKVQKYSEVFNRVVREEYLRDSSFSVLDRAFLPVLTAYRSQRNQWKDSLSTSNIRFLNECVENFPISVSAEKLRMVFERRILQERKAFYDCIESNPLTLEQRQAVVRDNDRNLILAAAGTGKTSVMVAKALDLVDRGIANPDNILILAYNRAAAIELNERLHKRGKSVGIDPKSAPQIMTFHSLGRKILQKANEPIHISIFSEDPLKLEFWISQWFAERIKTDRRFMKDFIDLNYQPINPFDFKTKREYDLYIRDNHYRTLQGERVKGYQELLISNWLFQNGIQYEYEPDYVSKQRVEIGFDYKPDFYLIEYDVYLEHFGIDRTGSTRPGINKEKYNADIIRKRELHEEYGTRLIETFHYNWIEDKLEATLEEHMTALEISKKKRSPEKMFDHLNESGFLIEGVNRYLKCLQAIRVEKLNDEQILDRLQSSKIIGAEKYSKVLTEIHEAYVEELTKQKAIDFDDMIIKALRTIESGKYKPCWTHILVDEFQDISGARMQFLQSLVDKGNSPRLTVVGDDWQSIYRFSGGKLELTTQFEKRVGSCSISKLQKTFRYNNSIAKTAGKFVMQNPEQIRKDVVTHNQVDSSQVFLLDSKVEKQENIELKTAQVIQQIVKEDPNGTIAVLARYRYLLSDTRNVVSKVIKDAKISYWTFHGSKGLEADYCILIGFFQGKIGFPNESKEEAVVEALLPSLDKYSHSEERRLLYVGITRAKHKCYLIADPMAPSEFVIELLSPEYNIHIASSAFKEEFRKIFQCHCCTSGYFKLQKSKHGNYYQCTSGSVCPSKPRICPKCGAPSIDDRHTTRCNNVNCGFVSKICSKCGRPIKLRTGKFGKFWGCTGFRFKDDPCNNTEKFNCETDVEHL